MERKISIKIDYKKEYKDLYMPQTSPVVIQVPSMNFIMVEGKGNPNEEEGEYSAAVGLLYALSYTIKMSKMGNRKPEGYFDYVVPPLEGLWWLSEDNKNMNFTCKQDFCWYSMIRQPEFVTPQLFEWACNEVAQKKKLTTSLAKFITFQEGLCVQCMHIGSYDDEPATIQKIEQFIEKNGLLKDITSTRRHHEIYLGDPRKIKVEKRKTILRIPVRKPD